MEKTLVAVMNWVTGEQRLYNIRISSNSCSMNEHKDRAFTAQFSGNSFHLKDADHYIEQGAIYWRRISSIPIALLLHSRKLRLADLAAF